MITYYIICALAGYLIGSIPFGYIIVKLVKGIDIRTVGSGNIGATNVARILGWPLGIIVLLLDALKGITAILLALLIIRYGEELSLPPETSAEYGKQLMISAGILSIIGHLFPVWLKFKGGKGIATALGVFILLMEKPIIIALVVWIILVIALRYISLASIIAAISLPISYFFISNYYKSYGHFLFIVSLVTTGLVIIKHIPNIKRLIAGTEPRLGGVNFRRSKDDKTLNP